MMGRFMDQSASGGFCVVYENARLIIIVDILLITDECIKF